MVLLRAEHQGPRRRVQPVGADEKVGTFGAAIAERDSHRVRVLLDGRDRGAEPDGHVIGDGLVQHRLDVTAQDVERLLAHGGRDRLAAEREAALAAGLAVNQLARHEGAPPQLRQDAHPLGPVMTDAAERHPVTATAPRRGPLDHQAVPARLVQAQRRGESGDSRSDDDGTHVAYPLPLCP